MKLINNKYVKIDRFDIFKMIVETEKQKNYEESEYWKNMANTLLKFEMDTKPYNFITELYLSYEYETVKKYVNKLDSVIDRQVIVNAFFFAYQQNNTAMAQAISRFMSEKQVLASDLGDLVLDFILENSIDINEYFDGEEEKLIYDQEKNEIYKGYIYNENNQKQNVLK